MITKFDPKELEILGFYANVGSYYGAPFPEVPVFRTPVSPKENLKGYLERREYHWVPNLINDINWICPDMVPDVYAVGFEGGMDAFQVEWTPTHPEMGLPAIVKPGNPKLLDIADWERVLEFPDVASWDWEAGGAMYREGSPKERMSMGVLNTAYFERLIALMDFENAAMCMVEDPDSVCALFERLTDFNIRVAEHYKKYFKPEILIIHDDWGSQRAPFFSRETLRKTILPFYKRLVSRIHEMDMYVMTHCDGNVEPFVPEMIEAGSDMWNLQANANPRLDETVREYGDRLLFDILLELNAGMGAQAYRAEAERIYKNSRSRSYTLVDEMFSANDTRARINYECARKAMTGEL